VLDRFGCLKKICYIILLNIFFIQTSHALFYASAGLKAGYGTAESTDKLNLPSTTMIPVGVNGELGLKFSRIIIGLSGEYTLYRQYTEPSEVSNLNSQGTLKTVYPVIGLDLLNFRAIARIPLNIVSDYTLDKKNASGQEVVYSDAKNISFQLHYKLSPLTYCGLEYQKLEFEKLSLNGASSTLADADKFHLQSISLLYGLFF